MRLIPGSLLLTALAALLFCLPRGGLAQSAHASADVGWGSVWAEPANEQQRQHQALQRQLGSARQARDFKAEVGLCDQAIQKAPDDPTLYGFRAVANSHLKRFDQALADLDRGQAIAEKRRADGSVGSLLQIRARLHAQTGSYAAAADDLQALRKLFPNQPLPLNNLAWLRATAPDAAARDGGESVRLAKKAVGLQRDPSYFSLDTLAAAYAEAGDYPQAVVAEQRALEAGAKQIRDAGTLQKFQREAAARQRLFEQRQPYHASSATD